MTLDTSMKPRTDEVQTLAARGAHIGEDEVDLSLLTTHHLAKHGRPLLRVGGELESRLTNFT